MIYFSVSTDNKHNQWTRQDDQYSERLLSEIGSGDKDALARLYVQTKAAVYGFALSILRNTHSAEDVMQETYVRIFLSAVGYTPQGKPMAWILRIARNLALMKLREKEHSELTEVAHFTTVYDINVTEKVVLEAAINILSADERQIIVLHSMSGLKHREIGALLALPLSTVLSKYRRALQKLQKYMKEDF